MTTLGRDRQPKGRRLRCAREVRARRASPLGDREALGEIPAPAVVLVGAGLSSSSLTRARPICRRSGAYCLLQAGIAGRPRKRGQQKTRPGVTGAGLWDRIDQRGLIRPLIEPIGLLINAKQRVMRILLFYLLHQPLVDFALAGRRRRSLAISEA